MRVYSVYLTFRQSLAKYKNAKSFLMSMSISSKCNNLRNKIQTIHKERAGGGSQNLVTLPNEQTPSLSLGDEYIFCNQGFPSDGGQVGGGGELTARRANY